MTKHELIERVYKTKGEPARMTKKAVAELVEAVFAEMGEYFIKAKPSKRTPAKFTYPGFGTFTRKRRAERTGRDPRTGQPIPIPASVTVTFSPGQDLREELNVDRRNGGERGAERQPARARL